MTNQQRLREIIIDLPGDSWGEKVSYCADLMEMTTGRIYKWLSNCPPIHDMALDALQWRLKNEVNHD